MGLAFYTKDSLKHLRDKSTFQKMLTDKDKLCVLSGSCLYLLAPVAQMSPLKPTCCYVPGSDHLSLFVAPCQQWGVESLCQGPVSSDRGTIFR